MLIFNLFADSHDTSCSLFCYASILVKRIRFVFFLNNEFVNQKGIITFDLKIILLYSLIILQKLFAVQWLIDFKYFLSEEQDFERFLIF